MSAPDPESLGLIEKGVGIAVALLGATWGFLKVWDKKLDKHTYRGDQQAIAAKFEVHRRDIAKIFDVLRAQEEKAEDRHRELLMHLLENKGRPN
jgi:hypothetical protein